MIGMPEIAQLEKDLDHFDPTIRSEALIKLSQLIENNEISLQPARDYANMHCHSFFSFNAYGYSPSSLAWLAKKNGYKLMGIIDFDVLAGVDEFLHACDLMGIAAGAGIETRTYLPEFRSLEINSPGEPGIYYNMGIGFSSSDVPLAVLPIMEDLHRRATDRNKAIIERVNEHLYPINIDYQNDVIPLTPGGNPTERHIVLAFSNVVERCVLDPVTFWAEKLYLPLSQVAITIQDKPQFQNLIRAKLMKHGGVGYIQPTPASFPSTQSFYELVRACNALPCATWLDGLSEGEQRFPSILELLVSKGAVAINIIPDRNWNILDPLLRKTKLENLYAIVDLASDMNLPINVGTEMNTYGQKLVDDFSAPELAPVRNAFLDGAYMIYGHTILQRALGFGYLSEWAQANFQDLSKRNQFFKRAGLLLPPGKSTLEWLQELDLDILPEELLFKIRNGMIIYG